MYKIRDSKIVLKTVNRNFMSKEVNSAIGVVNSLMEVLLNTSQKMPEATKQRQKLNCFDKKCLKLLQRALL